MIAEISSSLHLLSTLGNLLHYITLRAILACLTSLVITLKAGPAFIRLLHKHQSAGQPIRTDGPESHASKVGTPTMGGALLIFSIVVSCGLWANLRSGFVLATLLALVGFGLIGAWDDYLKLRYKSAKGLSAKRRLLLEFLISAAAIVLIEYYTPISLRDYIVLPFFKQAVFYIGAGFLAWGVLFATGFANAVNLTDGLDGLATGPSILCAAVLGIFSYVTGNHAFATYLEIPFVPNVGELSIVCAALIGASLGFLWFNAPPAEMFMGDTGSLALGASLSIMALAIKAEFALCVAGALFIVEMFSVIMQVGWYKYSGKRIFLMAPIHHHFEKLGWAETKIVIRFWIISIVLALAALSALKIR